MPRAGPTWPLPCGNAARCHRRRAAVLRRHGGVEAKPDNAARGHGGEQSGNELRVAWAPYRVEEQDRDAEQLHRVGNEPPPARRPRDQLQLLGNRRPCLIVPLQQRRSAWRKGGGGARGCRAGARDVSTSRWRKMLRLPPNFNGNGAARRVSACVCAHARVCACVAAAAAAAAVRRVGAGASTGCGVRHGDTTARASGGATGPSRLQRRHTRVPGRGAVGGGGWFGPKNANQPYAPRRAAMLPCRAVPPTRVYAGCIATAAYVARAYACHTRHTRATRRDDAPRRQTHRRGGFAPAPPRYPPLPLAPEFRGSKHSPPSSLVHTRAHTPRVRECVAHTHPHARGGSQHRVRFFRCGLPKDGVPPRSAGMPRERAQGAGAAGHAAQTCDCDTSFSVMLVTFCCVTRKLTRVGLDGACRDEAFERFFFWVERGGGAGGWRDRKNTRVSARPPFLFFPRGHAASRRRGNTGGALAVERKRLPLPRQHARAVRKRGTRRGRNG